MFPLSESSPRLDAALLEVLRSRRSRRFGLGMTMPHGPLAFESRHAPVPLSEEEEALLAFAACGVTGYALADLCYAPQQGGSILARTLGRTVPSGDAIQAVSLVVSNDEATYLMKRPQDFAPEEIEELACLAERGAFVELYRRSRIKIRDGRTAPTLEPLVNLHVNHWSLYPKGSSYFLPINELTFMYINGVLEILNEDTGTFIVDERASFQPAGLKRFGRSQGGHLYDDPKAERTVTIQMVESLVTEFVTVEQGMMLQNLALMTEAMGLGGFPHWAAHAFGWLEALGCRKTPMRSSKYLGMNPALAKLAGWLGRDSDVPHIEGLEKDGLPLLTPYCPPYFPNMEAAVRAVVEIKFGSKGTYRGGSTYSAWRDAAKIPAATPAPSEATIAAAIAYCDYIHQRYGRFPAYAEPFRTVLGFQANHLDVEFYDTHYRPEALTQAHRQHLHDWHGTETPGDVRE